MDPVKEHVYMNTGWFLCFWFIQCEDGLYHCTSENSKGPVAQWLISPPSNRCGARPPGVRNRMVGLEFCIFSLPLS